MGLGKSPGPVLAAPPHDPTPPPSGRKRGSHNGPDRSESHSVGVLGRTEQVENHCTGFIKLNKYLPSDHQVLKTAQW